MSHAKESKGYYEQSLVRGKNGKARNMSLRRKAGFGIGNFTDVTVEDPNSYQRERARQVRLGAHHREWVLSHRAPQIAKLVLGK